MPHIRLPAQTYLPRKKLSISYGLGLMSTEQLALAAAVDETTLAITHRGLTRRDWTAVLSTLPTILNQIQLWAVRWLTIKGDIRWHLQIGGLTDSTLIQLDDVHLIGVGILAGKSRQDPAKALMVKPRIFPKEGLASERFHKAIEPDPLKVPMLQGNRSDLSGGDATVV